MDLHTFLYGVYPYIAGVVFLLGSWIRFDHQQYTWKSDSSQLLSKSGMRWMSNFFHIGFIGLFFGHLVGMLTPHKLFLAMGVTDTAHQWLAMSAGGAFGLLCLVGGVALWMRRMFNKRVRAASRWMDINILGWLCLTALIGLSTIPVTYEHAQAAQAGTMIQLTEWVQSIATFQPEPELLRGVSTVYKLHIFFGLSVFLFFPFTRLVHLWSGFASVGYLFRNTQIMRRKVTSQR
jgi:nitrate reductase gamma subunit